MTPENAVRHVLVGSNVGGVIHRVVCGDKPKAGPVVVTQESFELLFDFVKALFDHISSLCSTWSIVRETRSRTTS